MGVAGTPVCCSKQIRQNQLFPIRIATDLALLDDGSRVADQHYRNADPDPSFHFNADPGLDPTFSFNQSDANLAKIFQGSILSLHCERPYPFLAHCELLKLHKFDFNAEPDPAFQKNADPDAICNPARICIQFPVSMKKKMFRPVLRIRDVYPGSRISDPGSKNSNKREG